MSCKEHRHSHSSCGAQTFVPKKDTSDREQSTKGKVFVGHPGRLQSSPPVSSSGLINPGNAYPLISPVRREKKEEQWNKYSYIRIA